MVHSTQRFFALFWGSGLFLTSLVLLGCSNNCPNQAAACTDFPPTDELCQAYFQRWFFDESTNQCQQIGYSGCGQYGFATQVDCEACGCAE